MFSKTWSWLHLGSDCQKMTTFHVVCHLSQVKSGSYTLLGLFGGKKTCRNLRVILEFSQIHNFWTRFVLNKKNGWFQILRRKKNIPSFLNFCWEKKKLNNSHLQFISSGHLSITLSQGGLRGLRCICLDCEGEIHWEVRLKNGYPKNQIWVRSLDTRWVIDTGQTNKERPKIRCKSM